MNKLLVTSITAGSLALAAVALAATAAAAPSPASAADTVSTLQAEGYNVIINGFTSAPLSRCSVTGIHPTLDDSASLEEKQQTLVAVDVSCPSDNR